MVVDKMDLGSPPMNVALGFMCNARWPEKKLLKIYQKTVYAILNLHYIQFSNNFLINFVWPPNFVEVLFLVFSRGRYTFEKWNNASYVSDPTRLGQSASIAPIRVSF